MLEDKSVLCEDSGLISPPGNQRSVICGAETVVDINHADAIGAAGIRMVHQVLPSAELLPSEKA